MYCEVSWFCLITYFFAHAIHIYLSFTWLFFVYLAGSGMINFYSSIYLPRYLMVLFILSFFCNSSNQWWRTKKRKNPRIRVPKRKWTKVLINLVPKLRHDRPVRNVALCKVALGGGNLHVYTLSYTVSPYVMIDISVQEKCEEQFMIQMRCGGFYWDTASICSFLLELWVLQANFARQPSTLFIVWIASQFSSCT